LSPTVHFHSASSNWQLRCNRTPLVICSYGIACNQNPQSPKTDSFQQSAIAATPEEKILSQTFSFSQKLLASVERRLDQLNGVARQSIATLLAEEWTLPPETRSKLALNRGFERTTWELKIPSLSTHPLIFATLRLLFSL
jgi:hypothetical protein